MGQFLGERSAHLWKRGLRPETMRRGIEPVGANDDYGGASCLMGCAMLFCIGMIYLSIIGEGSAEIAAVSLVLIAAGMWYFIWRRDVERRAGEAVTRQWRLREEWLKEMQAQLAALCPEGSVVAICRRHPTLLVPTPCIVEHQAGASVMTALRVATGTRLLDALASVGLSGLRAPLQVKVPYDDITYLGTKQPSKELTGCVSGRDDRLGRAAVGGLLFGGAGATVGALTGSQMRPHATFEKRPSQRGGLFSEVVEGREVVLLVRDGTGVIMADFDDDITEVIDGDLCHSDVSRIALWSFAESARNRIHEQRMGGSSVPEELA